jgi:hypothetical protein
LLDRSVLDRRSSDLGTLVKGLEVLISSCKLMTCPLGLVLFLNLGPVGLPRVNGVKLLAGVIVVGAVHLPLVLPGGENGQWFMNSNLMI